MLKKHLLYIFLGFSVVSFSQDLTVEKIWKEYQFFGNNIAGFRSMKDGERFTKRINQDDKDLISIYSFSNPEVRLNDLLDLATLKWNGKVLSIDDYDFNEDETKVLLSTETQSIYRRSSHSVYFLYDLKSGKLTPLDEQHTPQMYATYSPDGKKVAFVYENNLYSKDVATGNVSQLTFDGSRNEIINGATDWVYEEEFSIAQAFTWSPDSKYIAYLQFNEKDVKPFTLNYYGDLYPQLYTYKYPKAGEDNSKVTPFIVEVNSAKSISVNLPVYEYIPRLKWSGVANQLVLQTLNRYQNHLQYHLVENSGESWKSRVIFEEKAKTYIDIDDNLLILKNGKSILRTSEAGGFNHIQQVNFDGSSKWITQGSFDIIEFLGIDEEQKTIFYTAAEKSPIYQAIYRINIDGSKKKALSPETGNHDAIFSSGMKYFLKISSDANTPPTYSLCNQSGKELIMLEDNAALKSRLSKYTLSPKKFITIQGAQTPLNAWVIYPPNFDENKKYPVYMNVYGGPGSNMVGDHWDGPNYMYHQLLAQKGYIVISVDPRGTMYRGADFKKSTYLKLGELETEDFIAAAKNLAKEKYVDGNRIGIQGWSYGGFMSSLCITKGADVFTMGIAVAPVTSWRYYDNIYTERFMRTPQENAAGYDDNSPINHVSKLKGKYLLIHGSTDDNVHYQNTMDMVDALVKANKQFDLFIYPNKNHGIYGGNTRNHLFNMMLDYTLNNL